MSEERLDRIENMLKELMRLAESTFDMVSGIKADLSGPKEDVSVLKDDAKGLKNDMVAVKKEQELFRQELFIQSERIDSNHKEVMARLDILEEKMDYSLQVLQRHDAE